MIQSDCSKIINKVAKQLFSPFGITRKGQSRTWLDDQKWFTTVIEFQPFNGRQGTTLNIGVNFHWYVKDYFSFDIGYRQDVIFEYYINDDQFSKVVEKFCTIAIEKALDYRENLQKISSAKPTILKHDFTSENLWGSYHKGTICGILGDFDEQNKFYDRLLNAEHPVEWVKELKLRTNILKALPKDKNIFSQNVIDIIKKQEILKNYQRKIFY